MVIGIQIPFNWKAAGFQLVDGKQSRVLTAIDQIELVAILSLTPVMYVTRPVLASLLESLYGLLPNESFIK